MKRLVVGTRAGTRVGCSCFLPPQSVMDACTDANGLACFDRTIASQPIELKPASFKASSATKKAKIAAMEKLSSDDDRDKHHLATKKAKSTMAAVKVEPPPASAQPAQPSNPVITIATTERDRKSTRLNSSHANISYAVFC